MPICSCPTGCRSAVDDLKHKLIGVVIVVLAVLFLGHVVAWDGQRDLLRLGGAIALVIAALSYFLSTAKGGGKGSCRSIGRLESRREAPNCALHPGNTQW